MAKILVLDTQEGTRVPFLRGILTRSLQDAGMPFERAYQLAAVLRQELGTSTGDTNEITTSDLRRLVLRRLRKSAGRDIFRAYLASGRPRGPVLVQGSSGGTAPFSRSQHRRSLESCGLTGEEAVAITQKVYQELLRNGAAQTNYRHLRRLTFRYLKQDLGDSVARRYLVWIEFLHSGRPLLVLLGGVPGSGKSTLANEVAHRLENARIQSTDMLREVMRMMVPQRLMPVLHASSFSAWRELPGADASQETPPDATLIDGYRAQAELVAVACEAVMKRAITERVSLVLEGVHLHPAVLERLPRDHNAIVVPVLLGVLKPEQLRSRIGGRGLQVPDRESERYLAHFDDIWRLQSYLLGEAEQCPNGSITILLNDEKERAVRQVMNVLIDALGRQFEGLPEVVLR